jgi:lipopolysaccharide transport system ATP-binding protein
MNKAEIDRHFDEIVDFSEVEKFIDTPVKHYSSGMYLRLAFGVAAYLQPEILLVDEVLAVGDAQFQKKCLGKMDDVAKQGRTVLFVSHNMSAVQELCRRGLLIDGGRKVFDGTATECIREYYKRSNLIESIEATPHDDAAAFRVSGIRVNNSLMPIVNSGQPFNVSLNIQALNVKNPSIVLIVENITGQQMVHSRIRTRDLGHEGIDGKCEVSAAVPGLWLTPGVYSVYFKCLAPSADSSGRFYSERLMLEVRGDVDSTGKTLLSPETEWKLTYANVPIVVESI